tara:strand:+ start:67 stop:246 length:180 start_codon:yes stop_codon:yes gene_type:complete
MTIKLKIMMTMHVDEEEYHVPSDNRVDEEFEDHIKDFIHEIDGVTIRHMKILQENKDEE